MVFFGLEKILGAIFDLNVGFYGLCQLQVFLFFSVCGGFGEPCLVGFFWFFMVIFWLV